MALAVLESMRHHIALRYPRSELPQDIKNRHQPAVVLKVLRVVALAMVEPGVFRHIADHQRSPAIRQSARPDWNARARPCVR